MGSAPCPVVLPLHRSSALNYARVQRPTTWQRCSKSPNSNTSAPPRRRCAFPKRIRGEHGGAGVPTGVVEMCGLISSGSCWLVIVNVDQQMIYKEKTQLCIISTFIDTNCYHNWLIPRDGLCLRWLSNWSVAHSYSCLRPSTDTDPQLL